MEQRLSDGICNLGRNKKKTVLVVISLALSVTLLNVLCSFVGGFDTENIFHNKPAPIYREQHRLFPLQ